jgi:hypothetical protein
LTDGQVGVPYTAVLCAANPALSRTSDLCGDQGHPASNPSGGNAPYHFQFDSGSSAPLGLSLNLNGMLTGTPAATGSRSFSVCAVDLSACTKCASTSLNIRDAISGNWRGTLTVGSAGPCAGGTYIWSATFAVDGLGVLTVTNWYDTYTEQTISGVQIGMDAMTATFTYGSGNDSISLKASFTNNGTLTGTIVGPVCTSASGRQTGTWQGQRVS